MKSERCQLTKDATTLSLVGWGRNENGWPKQESRYTLWRKSGMLYGAWDNASKAESRTIQRSPSHKLLGSQVVAELPSFAQTSRIIPIDRITLSYNAISGHIVFLWLTLLETTTRCCNSMIVLLLWGRWSCLSARCSRVAWGWICNIGDCIIVSALFCDKGIIVSLHFCFHVCFCVSDGKSVLKCLGPSSRMFIYTNCSTFGYTHR